MSDEKKTKPKKTGFVVSDAMDKTISVRITRLVKHPRYGKYVKRYTTLKAHDEGNSARQGDKVEVIFARPLSKTKRWRLFKILEREGVPL